MKQFAHDLLFISWHMELQDAIKKIKLMEYVG